MHPQIANSFIRLLAARDRPQPRKRSWLMRLLGRA